MPEVLNAEWTPGAIGVWLFGLSWFVTQLVKVFEQWRLTKKLSLEDKVAAREGFAAQVTNLTAQLKDANEENRSLRSELVELRSEHRRERLADRQEFAAYREMCEAEANQLREQVTHLHNQVVGSHRARSAEQKAAGRLLIGKVDAPAATDALERIIRNGDRE